MTTAQKEFLLVLAYIYLQHAKYSKAITLYELLYEFYPEDLHIHKSLSYTYFMLEDYEQALSFNEQILAKVIQQEELELAYLLKAKILWSMGETAQSRDSLKSFIKQKPKRV